MFDIVFDLPQVDDKQLKRVFIYANKIVTRLSDECALDSQIDSKIINSLFNI